MSKKKKPRTVAYSFFATFIILALVTFSVFLYRAPVEVVHLPSNLPNYHSLWGKYVPDNVVLFGFENYSKIREQNSSYPLYGKLLDLVEPRISLNGSDISYFLTIVFETPNKTLDIAFVQKPTFQLFSDTLSKESSFSAKEGDSDLYFVRNRVQQGFEVGWLALIPNDFAVAYARGTSDARSAISVSLSVLNGTRSSVITRTDVDQMLYILNGPDGHLAVGFQNFPGVVRSGEMTFLAVDALGQSAQVLSVVKFSGPDVALSQYGSVKSAYLSATKFTVYDSYVLAVETGPISKITQFVRLVE